MAKLPSKGKVRYENPKPLIPQERRLETARWQKSYGMFITGQTMLDEVTLFADGMEKKWGAGRLRLVVGPELREKFDRQRYMLNQAIHHGELEDVRSQAARMKNAWAALDRDAEAKGVEPMPAEVWDFTSPSGMVYVFARNRDEAKAYQKDGRTVRMFSLEEVVAILDAQGLLESVKDEFPSAEVVGYCRRAVGDVLGDIWDTSKGIDDPLDDDIPF